MIVGTYLTTFPNLRRDGVDAQTNAKLLPRSKVVDVRSIFCVEFLRQCDSKRLECDFTVVVITDPAEMIAHPTKFGCRGCIRIVAECWICREEFEKGAGTLEVDS